MKLVIEKPAIPIGLKNRKLTETYCFEIKCSITGITNGFYKN